jgi:hypothetical protein
MAAKAGEWGRLLMCAYCNGYTVDVATAADALARPRPRGGTER